MTADPDCPRSAAFVRDFLCLEGLALTRAWGSQAWTRSLPVRLSTRFPRRRYRGRHRQSPTREMPGHQRYHNLPSMYALGTNPQCRLSELLLRRSPMTKKCAGATTTGPQLS